MPVPSAYAAAAPTIKPRDSMPSTRSTRPRKGCTSASMAARKASLSASRGVMSLKRMPGLGKSGMSRMCRFRSLMASGSCVEGSGLVPAVGAAQLHEAALAEVVLDESLGRATQPHQGLDVLLAHRQDE